MPRPHDTRLFKDSGSVEFSEIISASKRHRNPTEASFQYQFLSFNSCHFLEFNSKHESYKHECFIDVVSMLQKCCINVASMLQQCCINVAAMLHQCCINVAAMLQQCCSNVASMLQQCCINVASMLQQSCINGVFLKFYKNIARSFEVGFNNIL